MTSNSPNNLQNLSKEELLKMVQLLQSDNASLGDKVEQAETVKAKALEEKVQAEKAKAKAEKAKAKAEKAKAKEERALAEANKVKFQVESELNAVKTCIEENILTMAEIAKGCNKRIFIVDDVLSAKIAEQVEFIFKESNEWMLLAKAWLGQTEMGKKGSDVKRTNNSITKATEEVKGQKVATSLNNIKTGTTRIEKALVEVASNLKEEGSLSEKSFKKLVELGLNRKLTPAKKPSIGRVAKNRKTSAVKTGKVLNHICKICGGATKPLTDFDCSHYSQNLIQMASLAQTLAADVQNNYDLEYCTKCGQIKVGTKLNQDLPVVPNRIIGINTVARCCEAMFMGIPLERLIGDAKELLELGNDTVSYNLHDFVNIYLKPLYKQIETEAKNNRVIVADATPFDCLEAQGKRVCETAAQALDNGNELKTSSKNYMEGICSAPSAHRKFAIYAFLQTRGTEFLRTVINSEYKFKCIVTDAYDPYDTITQEHKDAKHQNCIVHLRRKIIDALNLNTYLDETKELTDDELMENLKDSFKVDTPQSLLLTSFYSISKIYMCEFEIDYENASENELKNQIKKAREVESKVMEVLDNCLVELSKGRVKENKKGNYTTVKGDQYAKACVYYLNHRNEFKTFLEDVMVPPDSNIVEAALMRPLTILRKNCNFKASIEYMNELAIIYSIWNTARMNGMNANSTTEYILKYCSDLHIYCVEKQLTQEYKAGNNITKRINSWNMVELSNGYDFSKWNIIDYTSKLSR